MCVVSVIYDQGYNTWPIYPNPQIYPWPVPNTIPNTITTERIPTPAEWDAFKELVEKARKFDELTGQKDCEDPKKAAWAAEIEERLRRIEGETEDLRNDLDCAL